MKKDKKKVSYKDILKRFSLSIREYKIPSILSMVFITLETLMECIIPYIMSMLLDLMGNASDPNLILNDVLMYAGILFALAICSFVFGILAARISAKASVGFATNLRQDIFDKISTFSFNNIDKFSVSSLVTRQTIDVSYIQLCYMMLIRICLRAPLMLIFSIVMAVIQSPNMSWVYAVTIPLLAGGLTIVIAACLPLFNRLFVKFDKLNESIEENVRGIRVVKTYVREDYEKEKFEKASDEIKKGFVKAERLIALSNPVMMVSMYTSFSLIIFLGSKAILESSLVVDGVMVYNGLTPGQMSSLITYGAQILSSLMMISMVFINISMSVASMKRIYEVLIEEPTIKNCENPIKELSSADISFKNVSFKYSENAEKYALSDINLEIKQGQTVGIVGGTGSSKSTLVNLISRFYDVSTGELLIGGKDIKEYDIEFLRENVSMVLQKNILFSGTINENLRWGNKFATQEEIIEASKIAQADSFVSTFPDGYETYIQQGGSNVSGGQKQRLCIARAILKKPKILILDDSTSAVDTKTDALIRSGLQKTLPNVTKIIIAQRLSSVENCDFIIVMEDGKINGIGTHEELLKNNEIYQEIYSIQNKVGGYSNENK